MNYNNLTLLIPIRIDSDDRLENIKMMLEYTLDIFKGIHIILLEADKTKKIPKELLKNIEYLFVSDYDEIFHRTKYINKLIKISKTKFISIYDSDIIMCKKNMDLTIKYLEEGTDMIIPYIRNLIDIPYESKEIFKTNKNVEEFYKYHRIDKSEVDVGGAVFYNKDSYISIGMENENFYGWGHEDVERYHRSKKLGLDIKFTNFFIYHLHHKRSINSKPYKNFYDNNKKELVRIITMNDKELKKETKTWNW